MLSALTFHNNEKCFHNIGLAKSLGYGKIKVKINHENIDNYLKDYELAMESEVESWAQQPQLTELITMATEQNNQKNSQLMYMKLEQFAKEQSDKEAKIQKLKDDEKAENKAKIAKRLASGIDFSDAKDYKGIEKTDENIEKLIECIKNVYPPLNAKAKKQFKTKSKEIVKWLGKERFDNLLNAY